MVQKHIIVDIPIHNHGNELISPDKSSVLLQTAEKRRMEMSTLSLSSTFDKDFEVKLHKMSEEK